MPKAGEARTEAQRKADKRYAEKVKEYKKENFANVSATFKKAEANAIKEIFTSHGIKTADAIRAVAWYLVNGGTIEAGQKPFTHHEPNDQTQAPEPTSEAERIDD